MSKAHHWSGWPGAYCLDCLAEDPNELCVAYCPIFVEGAHGEIQIDKTKCLLPKEHAETSCEAPPNPENCGQCKAAQTRV